MLGVALLWGVHAWHGLPPIWDDAEPAPLELAAPAPRTFVGRISGYCQAGTMRNGQHTFVGAVAVDPSVIPLGSRLLIEGLGTYVAADTGGLVYGNRIDVFMPSCSDAINWGVRTRVVTVFD